MANNAHVAPNPLRAAHDSRKRSKAWSCGSACNYGEAPARTAAKSAVPAAEAAAFWALRRPLPITWWSTARARRVCAPAARSRTRRRRRAAGAGVW